MNNVTTLGKRRIAASATPAPAGQTRIYLMRMMRAVAPNGEDILPRAKKTQAVLAYLCLARGELVLRSRLAGLIWDRSGEAQARESLRQALDKLNRVGCWRLERKPDTVRLDLAGCWIDVLETPDQPDLLLDRLYGTSPSFDRWLLAERTRFEEHWQNILEQSLNTLIEQQAAPELRAATARKLLNFLATSEFAVRTLMTAFAEMDDHGQAIREFERFRAGLTTNLGIPPSAKTNALYEAILLEARTRVRRMSNPSPPARDPVAQAVSECPVPADAAAGGHASLRDLIPSIAVLPFRNLSGDPNNEFVADGLAEDLVEALSRVPGLFVISRRSAATFKTEDRPLQQIAEALGVRYIIAGSIRLADRRLRLVVELTEAESGRVLWASRFDNRIADLLELQSELAEEAVRRVAPYLRAAELERVRIKRPEDYTAYDFFLRGQEAMHHPSRAVFDGSERLFEAAIVREPHYATALAWRAYWHVMRVGQGWSPDRAADTRRAEHFADKAIECDPLEPMGFAVRGHVSAYLKKDFDTAFAAFDSALQINPNSSRAWLWSASAAGWTNDGARAVDRISRAMALSPYDPLMCAYSASASLAYLADGQYLRAIEFARRSIGENPTYSAAYKLLIPALVMAGRPEEARAPAHQLLLLEPHLTVEKFRQRFPGGYTAIGEICCAALADAGVPVSS